MKNSKLEKLNVMLALYNDELYSLKDEKRKMEVELEDTQKEHKNEDNKSVKIIYGATIPTMLGLLGAILFPCVMGFSVGSFIIAGCIGILATYLAAPNYKKWVQNVKLCDALTDKIKDIQSKLEKTEAKIKLVENKIDTISNLINSYDRTSLETSSNNKLVAVNHINKKNTKSEIIR